MIRADLTTYEEQQHVPELAVSNDCSNGQLPVPDEAAVEAETRSSNVEKDRCDRQNEGNVAVADVEDERDRIDEQSKALRAEAQLHAKPMSEEKVEEKCEPQDINEAQDIDNCLSIGESVQENDSKLSPQPLVTKPLTFLESLTAHFAPETKVMWAQIFGPRLETVNGTKAVEQDLQSNCTSPRESVGSKSSLKMKLARERKLDEQIQASQRRYQAKLQRNSTMKRPSRVKKHTPRPPQPQPSSTSSFQLAGLSLTQIRVCTDKALNETCKSFRRLYLIAMERGEEIGSDSIVQGVYLTQKELNDLLGTLFGSQIEKNATNAGNVEDGDPSLEMTVTIQLQASYFLPFQQLSQLRSLVMKNTRRHLSEKQIILLNRQLQKQITLMPLTSKLDNLVIQLSDNQVREWDKATRPQQTIDVVNELLQCIGVTGEREKYTDLLLSLPVENVLKLPFSSVILAQRFVFFRFFIEMIATKRACLQSKANKCLLPSRPAPAQKPLNSKRSRRFSRKRSVKPNSVSNATINKSSMKINGDDAKFTEAAIDFLENPIQVADECVKPIGELIEQLESVISRRRTTSDAPVQLENNIGVDLVPLRKLKQVIDSLESSQSMDQTPHLNDQKPTTFSPPSDENDECESISSFQSSFPPAYAIKARNFAHKVPQVDISSECLSLDFENCDEWASDEFLHDMPPDYSKNDDAYNDFYGESCETNLDGVLQLQQRIFIHDFVQKMGTHPDSSPYFVPRDKRHLGDG